MLIMRNDDVVLHWFYDRCRNCGKEEEVEINKYQKEIEKILKDNDYDYRNMSDEDFERIITLNSLITKINFDLANKLESILNRFTQELLYRIYLRCPYKVLKNVCRVKLEINSQEMDIINNSYFSGRIFSILNEMTLEEKKRLLDLRETDGIISIGENSEIVELLPEVRTLIEKSLKSDLKEDFIQFLIDNNIESIEDFEVYQAGIENQRLIENTNKLRESYNNYFGLERGSYLLNDDSNYVKKFVHIIPFKRNL